MRALHRATLSLYTDLSLESTLRRVVHAAQELAGATYAALGIPDGKGGLQTFLVAGLNDEESARIPHLPTGRGLIGEMMRGGRSIRLPDLAAHPASVGFPPGHPPMRSFLGVPISAYGRPLGQIYLTDKRGAPEFTQDDQNLIELLAAHAAAAIENARLYQAVQDREAELAQRNEELELVNVLTSAASSTVDLEGMLESILDRVLESFDAQAAEVFLRAEDGGGLTLAVHRGLAGKAFFERTHFRYGEGVIGLVAASGKPFWTDHLENEPRFQRRDVIQAGFGSLAVVPLLARGNVMGVLSVAWLGHHPVAEHDLRLLKAVGGGVGIVIENARLYRQARRLAVLEERERIAMDLHDGIIQSIYAVGLTLDSVRLQSKTERRRPIRENLERAIDGLNAIIRDIRAYILDLQPSRISMENLEEALQRLIDEFKANSLMEADLIVEPGVADSLGSATKAAAFHIAQEAVANVGKHSHATRAWLSLRRTDRSILLQIIDNGRGFESTDARG
ncbi:MAG TPA: GAF domain-containing protein, partial [Anaerolineales bacterium]|nr:GAF domain-containing protein [Anaerolineales bacterium]